MNRPAPRHLGGPPPVRRFPVLPRPVDGAVALPPDTVRALRGVMNELRDLPKECIGDKAELIFWLSRQARRIEAVIASKARAPVAAPVVAPRPERVSVPTTPLPVEPAPALKSEPCAAPRAPSPRPERPPLRPLPARTAPATHWHARQVDPGLRRRAEAAGQLALSV